MDDRLLGVQPVGKVFPKISGQLSGGVFVAFRRWVTVIRKALKVAAGKKFS